MTAARLVGLLTPKGYSSCLHCWPRLLFTTGTSIRFSGRNILGHAAPRGSVVSRNPTWRLASTAAIEPEQQPRQPIDPKYVTALLLASGAIGIGYYLNQSYGGNGKAKPKVPSEAAPAAGARWPIYSRDEVSEHTTHASRIWVTYLDGVYDVTDFVKEHPGGDKILLAAGAGLEPFWDLYAVHKDNKEVQETLQRLRIGSLDASEIDDIESDDPYGSDPMRDTELVVLSKTPFNAEAPYYKLSKTFHTPSELFYVRNHLPVPNIDINTFSLAVSCPDLGKKAQFSLHDITTKFEPITVDVAVQCAGNRRDGINKVKETKGLKWNLGAISNATWTGARLRDVLISMGITDENKQQFGHVCFEGCDQDPTGAFYGASIPIAKAMAQDGDVLLAYKMNGLELSRDHGYPLRVIVPGVVGARNVKWVQKIEVTRGESLSHWQQNDYKLFSPSTDWDTVDFTTAPAIQEGNVQSAICTPALGDVVKGKEVRVSGYAWSGGGRGVVRVDVSADGGETWHVAKLEQADQDLSHMWAWTLWTIDVPLPSDAKGEVELICKATDSSYNAQPDFAGGIWNLRGCLNNSWHRVKVHLKH